MNIKKVFLLAMSVLVMSSCEKIKDLAAVDVDTNLNVDIPLEAEAVSVSLKAQSIGATYNLSGSAEVDLKNNEDLKDYVEGIRNMNTDNPLFEASGLSGDNALYNVKVSAQIYGSSTSYAVIDVVEINTSNLSGQVQYLNDLMTEWTEEGFDNVVTFSVSGTSNFDPKASNAKIKLKIPATVRYTPL